MPNSKSVKRQRSKTGETLYQKAENSELNSVNREKKRDRPQISELKTRNQKVEINNISNIRKTFETETLAKAYHKSANSECERSQNIEIGNRIKILSQSIKWQTRNNLKDINQ